jgi:hypothetical protein
VKGFGASSFFATLTLGDLVPMFIDFKARGELVAAHKCVSLLGCISPTDDDKFVILVNTGSDPHPWVVSTYTSGCHEWDSGRYFGDYSQALSCYQEAQIRGI